jgi:hypothetical protein
LNEPARITNRTTPIFIIVNRLFTVDDSFTPSARATETYRISQCIVKIKLTVVPVLICCNIL